MFRIGIFTHKRAFWSTITHYFSFTLVLILGFFLSSCEKENLEVTEDSLLVNIESRSRSNDSNEQCEVRLLAGQHTDVGSVTVSRIDDESIKITYQIEAGWCLTETHLSVKSNPSDFPQTQKGNPKPGRFEYKADLDCTNFWEKIVHWDASTAFIAAHAVVCKVTSRQAPDLTTLSLPETVNISVDNPGPVGVPSYFDLTVTNGGELDGIYDSNCIDTDNGIQPGKTYTAQVFSSYEDIPAEFIGEGKIDFPDNLDIVNWIINQGFTDKISQCNGQPYTFGDVQRAIWEFIDNKQSTGGLGSWSSCSSQEIIDQARAEGDGYEPGCGDRLALIFIPVEEGNIVAQIIIGQIVIGEKVIPCEQVSTGECETAWGAGTRFIERGNWATYFSCSEL